MPGGRFSSVMEEPTVISLDESFEECPQNAQFVLVGKILSSKVLNKVGVQKVIEKAWRTEDEFSITPWKDNVYAFGFKKEDDLSRVICRGPWSVMGSLLVLRRWDQKKSFGELDFNFSPFWIQVHGLPLGFLNSKAGMVIAKSIGDVIAVEEPGEKGRLANFMRVRIWVDISKPLKKGFFLRKAKEKDSWVRFRYERLSDFCYGCGMVGHVANECKDKRSFDAKTWDFDGSLRADYAVVETINYGDNPLSKLVYPEPTRHQQEEDGGDASKEALVERVDNNDGTLHDDEAAVVGPRGEGGCSSVRTKLQERNSNAETNGQSSRTNIPDTRKIHPCGPHRVITLNPFPLSVSLAPCGEKESRPGAKYYVEEPDSPRGSLTDF
ncbi:hypothetical protein RHGRI_016938 [Rhododendron griersonianum]|uniref:CCHC-type domain-containing protein n=1 Tax=Rhododendron griersonianum TaxID=479676 RepID=A0AAV6JW53_9ERIC|nr:hypothetical protein RHGRI_016938 [Rhododendron griersonianum]